MPTSHGNIVLVGFMGTGKTTIGQRLANLLERRFVDMDTLIEEREGCTIPDIFRWKGEPFFRALERRLVVELAGQQNLVIATGGGIVLNPDNVADFSRSGLVICLRASEATILARVSHSANRPLLAGDDKAQRIHTLLGKRQPLYDAIPQQVDTDGRTPAALIQIILDLFHARQTSHDDA